MHVRAGCGLEIGKASCVEWTEIPPLWMNGLECDGHALWSDGAVGVGAVVARCHALAATVVGRAWESGTTVVRAWHCRAVSTLVWTQGTACTSARNRTGNMRADVAVVVGRDLRDQGCGFGGYHGL